MYKIKQVILLFLMFFVVIKIFGMSYQQIYNDCKQGDAKSCYDLSQMYANGQELIKNDEKSKQYLIISCEKNYAKGCFNLAILLNEPKYYQKARRLFEKNCNVGDISSCTDLGWIYEYGLGVKFNYKQSRELYNFSCNKGDAFACLNLGLLYKEGKGVNEDYSKAFKFFEMSCNMGNDTACYNIKNMNKSF